MWRWNIKLAHTQTESLKEILHNKLIMKCCHHLLSFFLSFFLSFASEKTERNQQCCWTQSATQSRSVKCYWRNSPKTECKRGCWFHASVFFCLSGCKKRHCNSANFLHTKSWVADMSREMLMKFLKVGANFIPLALTLSGAWLITKLPAKNLSKSPSPTALIKKTLQ